MASVPSISSQTLSTPSGDLELLSCIPQQTTSKPPILCLHGAFCSAHDFQFFLPYFASQGYPAYSLSLRGHGASWKQSWLGRNLLTTLDDYVQDISAALRHIGENHPSAPPPVVIGHSFGGGHLQYLLACQGRAVRDHGASQDSAAKPVASGLVLLAAAPLSGGGRQIMANWELVEASPDGYKYPWSPRSQLDTPERVRAAFFNQETEESVVEAWLEACRTELEGIRVGLSVLWPFGAADDVLSALGSVTDGNQSKRRKILCLAGELDRLVLPSMVAENAEAYLEASCRVQGEEVVMQTVVSGSAHHLAMDTTWETCARRIVDWMEGRDVCS